MSGLPYSAKSEVFGKTQRLVDNYGAKRGERAKIVVFFSASVYGFRENNRFRGGKNVELLLTFSQLSE
jgi:hypothetical protein